MNVTINTLMTEPDLFGNQFSADTWNAWRALLSGFYGLSLTLEQADTFARLTGGLSVPESEAQELWLAIGRRGGKSQIAALLAVFEACFQDYTDRLAPGEVATVMVIAQDRKQARNVMRYLGGLLHSNAMLERMIDREEKESIELSNRTVIEVGTASFRGVRGYSVACVIADEIAFWRSDESANPDTEILNALRPAMATLDGKLIALSSPYAKRGALWDTYRRNFSKSSSILVAQADSRTMNPSLPERVVTEAMERDPQAASAEYGAQFRDDISTFITRELLDDCTRRTPRVIPPQEGISFKGFVDMSGGGPDEHCLSIAFRDGDRVVVVGVWAERGNPGAAVASFAGILKEYRISNIEGDRYAAEWPRQEFMRHGVTLSPSAMTRSEIYQEFLPLLNTSAVELPPDERALNQFAMLERRTARSGRDSIDHGVGGHDDRCNAIAGAARLVAKKPQPTALFGTYGNDPTPERRGYRMNESTGSSLCGSQGTPDPEYGTWQLSTGECVRYRKT